MGDVFPAGRGVSASGPVLLAAPARLSPDGTAPLVREGAPMPREYASPVASTTFASFDGMEWDCYTVRLMPSGSWAVVHRRGAAIGAGERGGPPLELVAGFPTRIGAWRCAARLAQSGFARGAASDRRRWHTPRLRPEALRSVAGDTAGDPARLGRVLVTALPPSV
jgi:hypothetical protein